VKGEMCCIQVVTEDGTHLPEFRPRLDPEWFRGLLAPPGEAA